MKLTNAEREARAEIARLSAYHAELRTRKERLMGAKATMPALKLIPELNACLNRIHALKHIAGY